MRNFPSCEHFRGSKYFEHTPNIQFNYNNEKDAKRKIGRNVKLPMSRNTALPCVICSLAQHYLLLMYEERARICEQKLVYRLSKKNQKAALHVHSAEMILKIADQNKATEAVDNLCVSRKSPIVNYQ